MTDPVSATPPNSNALLVHSAEQAQREKPSPAAKEAADAFHRSVPAAKNASVGTKVNTLA